jgi:predicted DCC family thiol-disulfide oxidoreductase YuxK
MSPTLWAPVPARDLPEGLILFDGVCVFCSRWVRFVMERDEDRQFVFVPIQSPYGRIIAARLGIDPDQPQTNVVIRRGVAHFKSDAALQVLACLPRWSWSPALTLVPRRWRDAVYDRIAANRYRLFGRTETCLVPGPATVDRFIFDQAPAPRDPGPSPFSVLLGPSFERLPEIIRHFHAPGAAIFSAGLADVSTAPGILPALICRIAGLPRPGRDVPVSVSFHPEPRFREYWARRFADRTYSSTMSLGSGSAAGTLVERFGPFRLRFDLLAGPKGLVWSLAGWRFLLIPLPHATLPQIACFETDRDGRFGFDIAVAFPLVGPVIEYRGWLAPEPP